MTLETDHAPERLDVSRANGRWSVRWLSAELVVTLLVTLVTVSLSWGSLSTKLDNIAMRVAEHIGDTQRHQPILEKQRMVNEQIDAKLAPLIERIHQLEMTLTRVEANQIEVLRILGARPAGSR
jgi:hypothetical protein